MANIPRISLAEPTTIAHHSGMNKYMSKTEIHTSFLWSMLKKLLFGYLD